MGFTLEKVVKTDQFNVVGYTLYVKPSGFEWIKHAFRFSFQEHIPYVKEVASDWLQENLGNIDEERIHIYFSQADYAYRCHYQVR